MPALGITGGIASGKSTFTQLLASELSAAVFDSDRFVHQLLRASDAVIGEIAREFGSAVLDPDGSVNRGRLGAIIFPDLEKRRRLESILHPRVRDAWRELQHENRASASWLLIDIPLLFETSADRALPATVVVGCSRIVQLDRLENKRGLAGDRARSMIEAQMPLPAKLARATHVIWNDGALDSLREQTQLLAAALRLP